MGRHSRRGTNQRLPKGDTPRDAHDRQWRALIKNRGDCVAFVRQREQHHCRNCARRVQYTDQHQHDFGCVHAFVGPAHGGDPLDPNNHVLVCAGCRTRVEPCLHPHAQHVTRLVIKPLDEDALMAGPIVFTLVTIGQAEASPTPEVDCRQPRSAPSIARNPTRLPSPPLVTG